MNINVGLSFRKVYRYARTVHVVCVSYPVRVRLASPTGYLSPMLMHWRMARWFAKITLVE